MDETTISIVEFTDYVLMFYYQGRVPAQCIYLDEDEEPMYLLYGNG